MYADSERVCQRVPGLRLLTRDRNEIKACALRLQPLLSERLESIAEVLVSDCDSQIGSGAQPVSQLPCQPPSAG